MKKQSDLSRLMGYAGKHKYFTYDSWVLAALSAFVALLPFIYIWKIVKEVLDVAPNFSEADRKSTRLNSSHVKRSRMPSSA